jgi:hypothetical protein
VNEALRPSITPSPSTVRHFSSNMMSAESTALSTDMPTSAAFNAGPFDTIPQKSDDMPLPVQGVDDRSLLRRRDLREHRGRLGQACQLDRRERRHLAAEPKACPLVADPSGVLAIRLRPRARMGSIAFGPDLFTQSLPCCHSLPEDASFTFIAPTRAREALMMAGAGGATRARGWRATATGFQQLR